MPELPATCAAPRSSTLTSQSNLPTTVMILQQATLVNSGLSPRAYESLFQHAATQLTCHTPRQTNPSDTSGDDTMRAVDRRTSTINESCSCCMWWPPRAPLHRKATLVFERVAPPVARHCLFKAPSYRSMQCHSRSGFAVRHAKAHSRGVYLRRSVRVGSHAFEG